jgi:zinc transport system ATP-binding protein
VAVLVAADSLALGYGKTTVLSSVSLSLERGEGPLALCGPNGGGKSTFLKACLGIVRPRSGSLRVLGARPGNPRTLRRIGFVPRSRPGGGLRVTALELAAMGMEAVRGPLKKISAEDKLAVEAALERCDALDLRSRPADELSGGQYQRVLLARALAPEPELLLLDEPGAHLDAESRGRIISLIDGLAASGNVGLLVVSHDRDLLSSCSRFIHFEAGSARETPVPLGGDDA